MLAETSKAKYLFEIANLELFSLPCIICGPKLVQDINSDGLTAILDRAWARAASENLVRKLTLAGLLATREDSWDINCWDTSSEPTTQPLIPPGHNTNMDGVVTGEAKEVTETHVILGSTRTRETSRRTTVDGYED